MAALYPTQGYRDPLYLWLQDSQEGETFIRRVFINLGELFNVHRRLLQNLQETATDPREFGQVFVKAVSTLSLYLHISPSLSHTHHTYM